jgi:hypothetical protein
LIGFICVYSIYLRLNAVLRINLRNNEISGGRPQDGLLLLDMATCLTRAEVDMDENTVALVQGFYFALTGIWPLIDIRSFQLVTGPKRDLWLVKTVGVVITAIGAGLIVAGWTRDTYLPVIVIAIGSAAGLAGIDMIYALKKVILPVYLLDAVAEAALIVWWIIVLYP